MEIYSLIPLLLLCLFLSMRFSDAVTRNDFAEDFVFGAGSSAYQWEGAVNEDGRKPSIWDSFVHSHKKSNGDTTCDGYHKYKEDVQLMAETGLDAFRLSISWSRLIPNGRGSINPKGLLFYKDLINQLTSHGIQPHVTLHHYDLPQALEDEYGGWLDRRIIKDFTAYAEVCFREFGDSVKFWTTVNEANVFAIGGYVDGYTPPGHCSPNSSFVNCSTGNSSTEPYIAMHHILLAHASAARLYKQRYKDIQGGFVGISVFMYSFVPCTDSKDDAMATQQAKAFYHGWILDPITFGEYPVEMKRRVGSRLPNFTDEESELVKGSSDFIGVMHYSTMYVKNQRYNQAGFYTDMGVKIMFIGNASLYEFGVNPWGMEKILDYIKHKYANPPIFILENGQSMKYGLSLTDTARVTYVESYIGGMLNAIRNGSDVRGYLVWSLMDMFELLFGYEYTFGLYYVNFSDPDRKRSPKLSAHWYSAFLKGETSFLGSQDITQLQTSFSASAS